MLCKFTFSFKMKQACSTIKNMFASWRAVALIAVVLGYSMLCVGRLWLQTCYVIYGVVHLFFDFFLRNLSLTKWQGWRACQSWEINQGYVSVQGPQFNATRRKKYGNVFKTNTIGQPMVRVTGHEYVGQVSSCASSFKWSHGQNWIPYFAVISSFIDDLNGLKI